MNWLHLALRGGVIMIPIALLSVVAVYLYVERLLTYRRARQGNNELLAGVWTSLQAGRPDQAMALCRSVNTPVSRMLRRGLLKFGGRPEDVQAALQTAGREEAFGLERGLGFLATIAGVEPMLGFLGTVTGMVAAFQTIEAAQGQASPGQLAGGIYQALITTVFGLVVGIPALMGYNHLTGRVTALQIEMENAAAELMTFATVGK